MRRSLAALACALVLFVAPAVASAQPRGVAHPWHEVDPEYNGKGDFRVIIEIPKGSKNKYEVDKPTGLLKLDRVLRSDVGYPADYGFIPKTYGDDHDPLDVLVLTSHPVEPLAIVPARAIGVMRMIDQGEGDDKIIAVNPTDPVYGKLTNISELPPEKLEEITHFFKTYKIREGKKVEVETPTGPDEAEKIIAQSFKDYEKLQADNAAKAKAEKAGPLGKFLAKAGDFLKEGVSKLVAAFRSKPAEARVEKVSSDDVRGERPASAGMSNYLLERVREAAEVEGRSSER